MGVSDDLLQLAQATLGYVQASGPDNVMAICPFHLKLNGQPERTPSFAFSLTTGLYFCHSCKAKGNLRQFLHAMGLPKERYQQVLSTLSKQTRSNTRHRVIATNEQELQPIPEYLLGLFDKCPLALLDEGFEESVLRYFEVGYDDSHRRITYPLRDHQGTLVGISGRTVDDIKPRYKVYNWEFKEWGLSDVRLPKSEVLWNAHRVYPTTHFSKGEKLFIVEGFKACMWLVQAGYPNVVALMGSYLSPTQLEILEHMGAGTYYLMLDKDDAGLVGTAYAGQRILSSLGNVRVVQYETHQPSDLPEEEIHNALRHTVDYVEWALDNMEKVNAIRQESRRSLTVHTPSTCNEQEHDETQWWQEGDFLSG